MPGKSDIRQVLVTLEKHLFHTEHPRLRALLPASVRNALRRTLRNLVPSPEGATYQAWTAQRIKQRLQIYQSSYEPDLLSFLTPVFDTPVEYLRVLADSLLIQCDRETCEWIVLDNGCTNPATIAYLEGLKQRECVKVYRVPDNIGIIGGVRYCLERARNRYILPLDSDDFLYPDCIRVITAAIQKNDYPPLLYTDEDKLLGSTPTDVYFKPGWDPVLFLNSAYIAHLGVIDRKLALELAAYTDANATGSHDWDTFVRFLLAGYSPLHVPEVLYSWRMHPQSTASNITSKSYIHSSQRAVLQRYLHGRPSHEKYSLDYSPLFDGTPDWWIRRKHTDPRPLYCVILAENPNAPDVAQLVRIIDKPQYKSSVISANATTNDLRGFVEEAAKDDGLILFLSDQVEITNAEWFWEVLTLTEIHPDTVMVGGRIYNRRNVIQDAGQYFGFGGSCGCPDRGRSVHDPGYFAHMWKQRSVSAVSTQFCAVDAIFLLKMLNAGCAQGMSLRYLATWAGAYALRTGKRIVYSPFLSGISDEDWQQAVSQEEIAAFMQSNRDIIPDVRFFSKHLSLESCRPYQLTRWPSGEGTA